MINLKVPKWEAKYPFASSVPSTYRGKRFVTAFSRNFWTFSYKIPISFIVTSLYFRCQLTGMFRVCTRCYATYTRASCFVKWFGPNWLELDRLLGIVVNRSFLLARLQPHALRVLTLSRLRRVDSPRHDFRSYPKRKWRSKYIHIKNIQCATP